MEGGLGGLGGLGGVVSGVGVIGLCKQGKKLELEHLDAV